MLRRPAVSPQALSDGLNKLGLTGTEHLIVHASLKSFGHLDGGARALVDVLEAHTATLVAPAFTYGTLMNYPTDRPRSKFHRDSKVSRDIGRFSQELVERADAERSFHPALSFVAMGQQAQAITRAQSLAQPYQPIGALYDLDGFVLLVGVDFGSNTTIHYGEYLAGVPLLTRYVPQEGDVVPTAFPNCSADFDNLLPSVAHLGRQVQVGQAELRLYRVRDLVEATLDFLHQNPEGLLCRSRTCRCQQVREMIRRDGMRPRQHVGLL